jgi:hypothetical protein
MCENDIAVDAWINGMVRKSMNDTKSPSEYAPHQIGALRGTIRELAATVPGVREWLIANMPKGEG